MNWTVIFYGMSTRAFPPVTCPYLFHVVNCFNHDHCSAAMHTNCVCFHAHFLAVQHLIESVLSFPSSNPLAAGILLLFAHPEIIPSKDNNTLFANLQSKLRWQGNAHLIPVSNIHFGRQRAAKRFTVDFVLLLPLLMFISILLAIALPSLARRTNSKIKEDLSRPRKGSWGGESGQEKEDAGWVQDWGKWWQHEAKKKEQSNTFSRRVTSSTAFAKHGNACVTVMWLVFASHCPAR